MGKETNNSPGTVAGHHGPAVAPTNTENKRNLDNYKREAEQRERHKTDEELSQYLIKKSDEIEMLDREKRLSLVRQQIKGHKYLDGNFYGYVNSNAEWVDIQREEGESWYTDNQIYPYLRTALMEMARSATELTISSSDSTSEDMQNVAKFAKYRYDVNRERTFRALKKQTENSYLVINGISFRYTYADFDHKSARKEKIPRLQKYDQKTPAEKVNVCVNCRKPRKSSDAAREILGDEYSGRDKCPCGSTEFVDVDQMTDQPDVIIGYDELPQCKNAWCVPNPVGITVSMQASCVRESPFLQWKQLIIRSVLENRYRGIRLPSTGTESVELRYITNQVTATPNENSGLFQMETSPYGDNHADDRNELELLEFRQCWLDYAVFCRKTFSTDQTLSNGKVLKAGQELGTMFRKGLYFARCGSVVLDTWNEDKNRKWSSSPYGIRAGSMYGTGASVMYADQETLNDLMRLKMANAWNNGVPREFVDPSRITELSADPAVPTSVNPGMGEGGILDKAYVQAPPQQLSAEIYALSEDRKGAIQNKSGAMSGSAGGGLADTDRWGETATAITIKRELAVGRFTPDLQLTADELDCEQAYQFLENEQDYFTPAQWKKAKGEFSAETVQAFINCDIRNDLNITYVAGSYMPKSDAQVQGKFMALAQLLPALMQVGNPELIANAFEIFGQPNRLGSWNADREEANRVVRRYKALCDTFINEIGDIPSSDLRDPVITQVVAKVAEYANMPIDAFLDNHAALSDAYRDLRSSDEGHEWSNLLTACIAQRVLEHQAGIAIQQQLVARQAQAGQEPIKEEVEADHAKQLEADNAAAEQARADQAEAAEAEQMDRLVEYNDRDENRNLQREMKAADLMANSQGEPGAGRSITTIPA